MFIINTIIQHVIELLIVRVPLANTTFGHLCKVRDYVVVLKTSFDFRRVFVSFRQNLTSVHSIVMCFVERTTREP